MSVQTWLMLAGAALVLFGALLRWRVSHYDLKDAAINSAWTLARGKRSAENPTALEAKYREINPSRPGAGVPRRRQAPSPAIYAQVLGVVSLVMMLAGLAAMLAGWLWR